MADKFKMAKLVDIGLFLFISMVFAILLIRMQVRKDDMRVMQEDLKLGIEKAPDSTSVNFFIIFGDEKYSLDVIKEGSEN